ncbi:hypothetical protein [Sphaerisporangium sp. NPDC051011]|uniref:hypothetical protein n=1 Tax=Sphaerisporangium sp. NPDC051011 TaxID=3155792 RepID=UPI0033DAA38F
MPVLLRALLAGIAVAVSLFLLGNYWPQGPEEDDFTSSAVMMIAFFPLSFLSSWVGRLPRWQLIGLLAPFATVALLVIDLSLSPFTPNGELPWFFNLFYIVGAFVLATWICAPGNRVVRGSVAGTVLLAAIATPIVSGRILDARRVDDLKNAGVPLIAPVIADYTLAGMDDLLPAGMIGLTYFPTETHHLDPAIDVYVMPGAAGTPEAACADPYPNSGWKAVAPCRQISPGVWTTRLENGYTPVYARHGDALVQVGGHDVTEELLLSVLPTFRPISAEKLVALKSG